MNTDEAEKMAKMIERARASVRDMEQRYGMSYDDFRSLLAIKIKKLRGLKREERHGLAREIMLMEDDALDWKFALDVLNKAS